MIFHSGISLTAFKNNFLLKHEVKQWLLCSSMGIKICPGVLVSLRSSDYHRYKAKKNSSFFFFPLKYSSAMYHCALLSQHILHTLSLLSLLPFLCLLHPKCYTMMTSWVCVCDKDAEQNCLYLLKQN